MATLAKPQFDVGIIGGGPAGAATAAYLGKAGLSCVVFEKSIFPRPHVGESLVPATTRVFQEIGFLEKMEQAGFVRKYGAAWTSPKRQKVYAHDWEGLPRDYEVNIRFDERAQDGVERNYTYHVDRARFDQLLLQHAKELGATVRFDTAVLDVDFTDSSAVTLTHRSGETVDNTRVRMLVDASGRSTFLGNHFDLRVDDPAFNQYALYTWFEGFDRGSSPQRDYIFVHFLPFEHAWLWQIPISASVTSLGVVLQKEHFAEIGKSKQAFLQHVVGMRPEVQKALAGARAIRPLRSEGDFSYSMKQICGDRFVLVGDAARFVDPIFSSGVSIALNSARHASQDIVVAANTTGEFSRHQFQRFEAITRRGCANWYRFITLYYRLNVLFTYFFFKPKYRLDMIRLLQGDVYDSDEPEVLVEMERIVKEVERNPQHEWYGLLGDLDAERVKPIF